MAEPRVSVPVTAYEHERVIARALDGVLEQRGVSFELLVSDDTSTDGTRAVIERYARRHPDLITTLLPDRNLGQGGRAIFAALPERARGEFVAGVDGDDFWTSPDKLRRQVDYMDAHPGAAMCFHDVLCRYEDGSRPDARFTGSRPARELATLFRRDAIHPLPDWFFTLPWGDAPLYIRAAGHGDDRLPARGHGRLPHPRPRHVPRPATRPRPGAADQLPRAAARAARARAAPAPGAGRHLGQARAREGGRWRSGRRAGVLGRGLRVEPFDAPRLRRRRGERRRLALWLLLTAPAPLVRRRAA